MRPIDWAALVVAVIVLAAAIVWGYGFAARRLYDRDKEVLARQGRAGPHTAVDRPGKKARFSEPATPASERPEDSRRRQPPL